MDRSEFTARMAELRRLHVPTDRDAAVRSQLARLLEIDAGGAPVPVRHAGGLETRGIALIDGPGGGKTTCIRRALATDLALSPPWGAPRHLHAQVPSPATLKSLGLEILKATGFGDVAERATAWRIWSVVRHRLSAGGIVVLWIDEAHDLFHSKGPGETDAMLNMLKSLMQCESPVVLILSGTDQLAEIIARVPQVDQRLARIVPKALIPGASEDHVEQVMRMYAQRAGLAVVVADALPGRLIHASRRRFGRMVETVIAAIGRAFEDGAPTLTRMHFAQAWGVQEGCDWEDNVFVAADWAGLDPEAAAEQAVTAPQVLWTEPRRRAR